MPKFKEATFKVNSQAVTGKLLPTASATTATGLWADLSAKNTSAVDATGAIKVTNTITVVNAENISATYTIVMNITDAQTQS